jgi:hypothetical protein
MSIEATHDQALTPAAPADAVIHPLWAPHPLGALLWHFAAMWLLAVNGLVYVALGVVTGRFRRKLVPIRPGEVLADAKAALTGKPGRENSGVARKFNASAPDAFAASIADAISSGPLTPKTESSTPRERAACCKT